MAIQHPQSLLLLLDKGCLLALQALQRCTMLGWGLIEPTSM
jgi:hypothetical protein